MWWPFRRSSETAGPPAEPSPAPVARPVGEWRSVPALQRVSTDLAPVAPLGPFAAGLASYQDPRFLAPLTHALTDDAPAGEIPAPTVPATTTDDSSVRPRRVDDGSSAGPASAGTRVPSVQLTPASGTTPGRSVSDPAGVVSMDVAGAGLAVREVPAGPASVQRQATVVTPGTAQPSHPGVSGQVTPIPMTSPGSSSLEPPMPVVPGPSVSPVVPDLPAPRVAPELPVSRSAPASPSRVLPELPMSRVAPEPPVLPELPVRPALSAPRGPSELPVSRLAAEPTVSRSRSELSMPRAASEPPTSPVAPAPPAAPERLVAPEPSLAPEPAAVPEPAEPSMTASVLSMPEPTVQLKPAPDTPPTPAVAPSLPVAPLPRPVPSNPLISSGPAVPSGPVPSFGPSTDPARPEPEGATPVVQLMPIAQRLSVGPTSPGASPTSAPTTGPAAALGPAPGSPSTTAPGSTPGASQNALPSAPTPAIQRVGAPNIPTDRPAPSVQPMPVVQRATDAAPSLTTTPAVGDVQLPLVGSTDPLGPSPFVAALEGLAPPADDGGSPIPPAQPAVPVQRSHAADHLPVQREPLAPAQPTLQIRPLLSGRPQTADRSAAPAATVQRLRYDVPPSVPAIAPAATTPGTGAAVPGAMPPARVITFEPPSLQRQDVAARQPSSAVADQPQEVVNAVSLQQMFADPSGTTTQAVHVQRQEAGGPPPAETQAAPSSRPAAPTASGPAAATDLDELARRLYDPLTARLRAELWLDRERAGLVTDRRR